MKKIKVNFTPLNKNILVYAPVVKEMTESGIIKSEKQIKEEEKKLDKFLEVATVANDVDTVKVGDKILIGGGNLKGVDIDGTSYIIVHELSIIGKRN